LYHFNRFSRLFFPVQQLLPSLPLSVLPFSRLNLPCLTERPAQLPVRPSCRCHLHLLSLRLSLMLRAPAMK
jgi:hypothetical protein